MSGSEWVFEPWELELLEYQAKRHGMNVAEYIAALAAEQLDPEKRSA